MRATLSIGLICFSTLLVHGPVFASNVHLFLAANGTALDCDSSVSTLLRTDSIEAFAFSGNILRPSGSTSTFRPLRFTKRIDKCTPLLAKALVNAELITGEVRFYRSDGIGGEEHYFTVEVVTNGRIVGQSLATPDETTGPNPLQLEHISLDATTIKWEHIIDGTSFQGSE